jgi:hypothetical protein
VTDPVTAIGLKLPKQFCFFGSIKWLHGNVGQNERLQKPRGAVLIGGDLGAGGKTPRFIHKDRGVTFVIKKGDRGRSTH